MFESKARCIYYVEIYSNVYNKPIYAEYTF